MIEPYYQDEFCTIYNADCRDVLPQLEPVDLVLTDPPYGIKWNDTGYFKESRIFHQGVADWDNQPSPETFGLILSKAKEGIVWGGNYFASSLGSFVAPLVWDKQNGTNRFADGEIAWTSFKSGTVRIFRHQWWGFLKESERGKESLHPTQKPVALMKWCIQQAGQVETILDPFMGSGTTLVAAKQLGLKSIGIELEEKYCAIAAERLRQRVLWEVASAA